MSKVRSRVDAVSQAGLPAADAVWRRLIENAPDSLIVVDGGGTIQLVNAAASGALPYGAPGERLFDRLPRPHRIVLRDAIRRAVGSGEPADYEIAIEKPGRETAWFLGRVGVVRVAAGENLLMIIARDITEHKRAEQDLDRLFNVSLDLLCVADTTGYFTRVSPAFEATLGYEAAELTALPFLSFVHADDRPATVSELAKLNRGMDTLHFENRYRCKDGTYRWLAWTARAPQRGGRQIYGVARDVTEQKRAAELARRHEAELAHLARWVTVGEMATGLAHELNQPLAAINNYAAGCLRRLAAAERITPDVVAALRRIVKETTRAGDIISHLRRLIRKREPSRAAVDVNPLIRQMCELIGSEVKQLGVELRLRLASRLPQVYADGVQIEQVILNLLKNAVDAVGGERKKGRSITVASRRGGRGTVVLTVQDNGPGLSTESAERLFEPFYTTKPDGLGMGLKISRTIVESHGGGITTEAVRGGGARFIVRLPAVGRRARRQPLATRSRKARRR